MAQFEPNRGDIMQHPTGTGSCRRRRARAPRACTCVQRPAGRRSGWPGWGPSSQGEDRVSLNQLLDVTRCTGPEMSAQFDFYPALGLRVWVAAHAVGTDDDAAAAWIPGTVVGVPVDVAGQWSVRLGPTGAQRTEWVEWTAFVPRKFDNTGASPSPNLPPSALVNVNRAPPGSARSNGVGKYAPGVTQSELSATRAAHRKNEFEQNAARHWDLFYRSNTVNFFKDRHWLDREFPEISEGPSAIICAMLHTVPRVYFVAVRRIQPTCSETIDHAAQTRWWRRMLRLGRLLCWSSVAVGSETRCFHYLLPTLRCMVWVLTFRYGGCTRPMPQKNPDNRQQPRLNLASDVARVAIQLQRRAIDFVKAKPEYAAGAGRCVAHVCDLATEPLAGTPDSGSPMAAATADIAMLCFVLSAVAPQSQSKFLAHVRAALKQSGLLLFRDYADGDLAQRRFRAVSASTLTCPCIGYFPDATLAAPWCLFVAYNCIKRMVIRMCMIVLLASSN